METTVDLDEVANDQRREGSPTVRVRPLLQRAGTLISFAAGMIAFGYFTYGMVVGEGGAEFGWPTFALVVLPTVAALCSLIQGMAARRMASPIMIAAAIELVVVGTTFLNASAGSTATVAVVSVIVFSGGLGLLAHVGVEAAQDREVLLAVGLLGAWVIFAGSLAMFVFGHTELIVPLGVCALGVVVLHILYDDPTALRRRRSTRRSRATPEESLSG